MFVVQLFQKEGSSVELVRSKGMVVFLIIVLVVTIIGSINTKKYDEANKESELAYISPPKKNIS